MTIVTKTYTEMPAEFYISIDSQEIQSGQWITKIVEDKEAKTFTAECHYNICNKPLLYDNLINLLASCRYTLEEEIAIMRLPDTDLVKIEHEAYIVRVKEFSRKILV